MRIAVSNVIPVSMDLAERVKFARERRGLSQRGLAARAGLSCGYLSILENRGHIKRPRACTVELLAIALEVPPAWLAFGVGRMPTFPREAA